MNNKRWTPYYTPQKVASKILKYIPKKFKPSVVIDICAGSGNFLSAQKKKWAKAEYYAIDTYLSESLRSHPHWNLVKLNSLHVNKLIKHVPVDKCKLVLANPPFGDYKKNISLNRSCKHLGDLLREANKTNRIEAKMLLANLSIMRDGDVFAAVLPENIFSSLTFTKFKEIFFAHFKIIKLGEPQEYFKGCEVRTRIFVGIYSETVSVVKPVPNIAETNLPFLQIFRGIDNSKLLDTKPKKTKGLKEVLHFNNSFGIQIKQKYVSVDKHVNKSIIESTDLLVIKVGRHAGKIFKPNSRFVGKFFSDYFFLVKNIKISRSELQLLEGNLRTNVKGLTTNYLIKVDLQNTFRNVA